MLKRDFIMVQIEELGKAIARLVSNRKNGDGADGNAGLIGQAFSALKTDAAFLLGHSPEEAERALDQDDGCGLQRLELAAKLLIEESYVSSLPFPLLDKARELLYYVQTRDSTYSIERVMLLQEVEHEMNRMG